MPERRTSVRLLALGTPEVRVKGQIVELPPKLLAVLVYLALKPSRDTLRRDTLLATFWPETDASRARNSLNQVVHQLRKRLGNDVLESRGKSELSLNGYLESDVEQFETLLDEGNPDSALALYRGAFLEGFHVRNAPGFERWLDGVRARLRKGARETALTAAKDAERDGQPDLAIGYLRRALEIVPTDERVVRRLIRLLLAAGDRDAALRTYRRFARRLATELGASPSKVTRELVVEAGAEPAVPEAISLPSRPSRLARELTDRAAELLMEGRGENLAVRELLEQATRADPTYAPAHAQQALAIARWVELYGGPREALETALVAAGRALEIAPGLAEAYLARGMALEDSGRVTEAIRSYRAALRHSPHDGEAASRLGMTLIFAGDFTEASNWIRHCGSRAEDASVTFHGLSQVHLCLGQHDAAEEWHRRAISSHPEDRRAQSSRVYHFFTTDRIDRAIDQGRNMVRREPDAFIGHFSLAEALFVAEDFDGAIDVLERCYRRNPDGRNWAYTRAIRTVLGYSHLRAGDAARGRQMLEVAECKIRRLLAARPTYGAFHWEMAAVLAAQGRTEAALSWLERSCEHGWLQHIFLELDPIFTDLRDEPRFQDVASAMRRNVAAQRKRVAD